MKITDMASLNEGFTTTSPLATSSISCSAMEASWSKEPCLALARSASSSRRFSSPELGVVDPCAGLAVIEPGTGTTLEAAAWTP